jgi:hypothetical protein
LATTDILLLALTSSVTVLAHFHAGSSGECVEAGRHSQSEPE